jgi:EmrB/QacA subfamily drug resistance transporter
VSSIAAGAGRIERAGRSKGFLLALICVAQFMVILDASVVNVALPSIKTSLHFSTAGLQWVVNAYTLTFAGLLMLGGRASDLLGRRRVLLTGIALFTLSSLACALSDSSTVLVGARAFQGIGGAIVSPASLSIVTTSFAEGRERNRALGMWGAIGGIGGASGALLGGILTQGLGWQWIFLINVPFGLAVLALAPRIIPEGRAELGHRHFDVAGALLVTGGFVALVYGIVRTEALGWTALGSLGPIGAGILALVAFALVEGRFARAPLVPLSIFRLQRLRAANTTIFLLYTSVFGMWFFVSLYLQQVLGYNAIDTGLVFVPLTLTIAITSTRAPRVLARLGARRTITLGMSLAALGMFGLTLMRPGGSFWLVLPGGIVTSLGFGLTLVPSTVVAVQGVPRALAGAASGLLNTSRLLGGALGLAALTTIAATSSHVPSTVTAGYSRAMLVAALVLTLGAVGAAVMLRPHPTTNEVSRLASEEHEIELEAA